VATRASSPTQFVIMSRAEVFAHFGGPDLLGALCGYTREDDTRAVLTLLCHAQPRRVLEVGTALGHMTANLTRWTPDDAQVFTLDLVRGMPRAAPGAPEQEVEVPTHSDWGRFANHFGTAHKAFFIRADTITYDFGRLAPLEFVFIDGGHALEHVLNDSRKAYDVLVPGGWLVWHDFNSPVPWVQVREAIEQIGFAEAVVHVEGTEVGFLRKGERQRRLEQETPHLNPPPHGGRRSERRAATAIRRSATRVAWEGDFEELHSLAHVNRAVCRKLIERGHDLGLLPGASGPVAEPVERQQLDPWLAARYGRGPEGGPAQVHVRHRWPPRLEPPPHGRWVLMQPWEYGSPPKAWLPMLRRVDEVWAYSGYVRHCYLEAGVPSDRVHVVPLGVDPQVFQPGLEPLPLQGSPQIRFLFVGGTIFRKGIDVLLNAFAHAFTPADGVGLVIKEMGSQSFYRGQTAEAEVHALRERGYPLEYIDRALSDAEMAGLYAACDCLVHPFRGEGFGLPVVEAMACGLPVIVTGAGPVLDYASEETAYLIPANRGQFAECRVGEFETIGRPWLFEPDADVLVELLTRVAGNRTEARGKAMAASAHIRENFTWTRTVNVVERRLLALADDERRRPRFFNPEPTATATVRARARNAVAAGSGSHEESAATAEVWAQDPSGVAVERQLRCLATVKPSTPGRAAVPVQASIAVAVGAGLSDSGVSRPKISLTMIVRDEEDNLPHCLGSVAGLFDEIVVLDTGSKDRTREIAQEFGARVFVFVWVDDFASARNAALARATGDYAFWLDADDVIDPPQRVLLERLIADLPRGGHAAYVVRCSCDPSPNGDGGQTVVDHIRLFPVREDIRWSYRVHEQILPALRRANLPVHWSDVVVRHTGYTDRELRARKLDRDCKILNDELAERPDDPFVLFNLGSIAIERQDWTQALAHLRHSLAGSAPTDSITRKLYALIARAHQMLGEPQQALAACAAGLEFDPDDAELLFREAIMRRKTGDSDRAENCWRRILTLKRPEQFSSVDQGIYGHLTRRNLAALARERGDYDEARRLWRAVLNECPNDPEARTHLRG